MPLFLTFSMNNDIIPYICIRASIYIIPYPDKKSKSFPCFCAIFLFFRYSFSGKLGWERRRYSYLARLELKLQRCFPQPVTILYYIVPDISVDRIPEYRGQYMYRMYIDPDIVVWYNGYSGGGVDMPATKAQQRAVAKYMKANYDEMKIRLPKGQKQAVEAHAKQHGDSINGL